jgi:hypothetical protein
VYKREELYQGPYINQAPDLFLAIRGGSYLSQKEIHPRELFAFTNKTSGTHRMNGVFMMKGAGVRKGVSLEGLRLVDLTPTILCLCGLPIPDDMDGRVLEGAFEEAFLKAHPPTFVPASLWQGDGGDGVYTGEEAAMVKERLRELGYMA